MLADYTLKPLFALCEKVGGDGKTEPWRGRWQQTETEQPGQGPTQVMMIMMMMMMLMSWKSFYSVPLRRKSSCAGRDGM